MPGARQKAEAGRLLFGTVETWLIWKLTDGKVHVTDYSNASRTMMFNINTLQWDDELLQILDIPKCMLPEPKPSSCFYGMSGENLFGGQIPISGAAAINSQRCSDRPASGRANVKIPTDRRFLLMNTGEKPIFSRNGLVTTIAWGLDGKVNYALEGSIFVAGAAVQWLRDELDLIETSPQSEAMAASVPDANGVYVVPAFVGLGAPYWDPYARGAVLGLTRGANKKHLVRATLESMAYQTKDLIDAMTEDLGGSLAALKVDGGASANNFLMQFQSDVLGCEVKRPQCIETTSLGAAYLAGLATGYWKSKEDVLENWQVARVFTPQMQEAQKSKLLAGWKKAVACVRGWAKDEA